MRARAVKFGFLFVLVCLMAPLTVAPAAELRKEYSRFGDIDALLDEAALAGTLSSLAGRELQQRCVSGFSGARILGAEMRFPLDDEMSDDLRHYHECEAFSRGDAGFCDRLTRYSSSRQKDMAERCRTSYIRFRGIELNVAARPDAAKVCESLPFSSNDLYGTNPKKECAWMTTRAAEKRCKPPISPALDVVAVKDCLAHIVLHAEEGDCSSIKDAPIAEATRALYQARCREAAAYRRAYQGRDAGICKDSLVCRMLMGEKVCGGYLEGFRTRFCRLKTQEKIMDGLFARLDLLMEGFEPKSDPGYLSRRESYRILRKNFDGFFKGGNH